MGEALQKLEYKPEDHDTRDHGHAVVTLVINSRAPGTPARFTEGVSGTEEVEDEFDPTSEKLLDHIKNYLSDLKVSLESMGTFDNSLADRILSIRTKISDLHDLMRFQSDAFSKGVETPQIEQRGLRIWADLQEILDSYDKLIQDESDESTEKRTGWWDKDFREANGVVTANIEGELKQVGVDEVGPVGFEPVVIEKPEVLAGDLEETIKPFIDTYPGGFAAFEKAFEAKFVSQIEKPAAKPSRFGRLVGHSVFTGNAFHALSALSVEEVQDFLVVENEQRKVAFLAEHGLGEESLNVWLEVLALWQETGKIRFAKNDRFETVARAAFIEHLKYAEAD